MKKLFFIICSIIILESCVRTNSTLPISSVQVAMNGKWQVDSTITTYNDTKYSDTVYTNHFVAITNDGNKVIIDMSTNDIMTYTISDSSLIPYYGQTSGGCGVPAYPTKISISTNNLKLVTNQGMITRTYFHR